MFENPRRSRQPRNFTTNVPKILDLKSSSEQIFCRKLSLGAPEKNRIGWQFTKCMVCLFLQADSELCSFFRKYVQEFRPELSSAQEKNDFLFVVSMPVYWIEIASHTRTHRIPHWSKIPVTFWSPWPFKPVNSAICSWNSLFASIYYYIGSLNLLCALSFQNANGQPYSGSSFSKHMKNLMIRLTGREVSINTLRSSFLTWAYSQR